MSLKLKMATVWFSVIVLITIGQVIAECDMAKIKSCDECIRCGGTWCRSEKVDGSRCTNGITPDKCSQVEILASVPDVNNTSVSPAYYERTLRILDKHLLTLNYDIPPSGMSTIKTSLINSTQTNNVDLNVFTNCKDGKCKTDLMTKVNTEFCQADGHVLEVFNVKVESNDKVNDAVIKYNVPCACKCSGEAEIRSPKCSGRGTYRCGVCECEPDRSGSYCEIELCAQKRGDIQCSSATESSDCSGNGECGPCETCVCYKDREGSQYYDESNCADICTTVNYCDECLDWPTLGRCESSCLRPTFIERTNRSLLVEKDNVERKVWIECTGLAPDGCSVDYAAKKDAKGNIILMILKNCSPEAESVVGGGFNVTIPVILSVLAIVAAGTAVAGYIVWKNRIPPVPLNDPQYENIGAEDCTGENPLYRPPTSSFKNPTYGKW